MLIPTANVPSGKRGWYLRMAKGTGSTLYATFITVIITEVIAFALYSTLTSSITSANVGGALAGQKGVLVGLVTLFYILAAALLPIGIVRKAGVMALELRYTLQNGRIRQIGFRSWMQRGFRAYS